MRFIAIVAVAFVASGAALRISAQRSTGRTIDPSDFIFEDFSGVDDSPNHEASKRDDHHDFLFEDFSGVLDTLGRKISKRGALASNTMGAVGKRDNRDYISSCGKQWVSIADFENNDFYWIGYASAVEGFCRHITADKSGDPTVVGPGAYTGATISQNRQGDRIGMSQGSKPTEPTTNIKPGRIEFEIHNKQVTGDHTPKC